MADDWPAYGRVVRERREALGLSQGVGGLSAAAWRNVEHGVRAPYRRSTLVKIARALGWPDDAFDRMRAGRPPDEPMADDDPDYRALERRLDEVEALAERLRADLAAISGRGGARRR